MARLRGRLARRGRGSGRAVALVAGLCLGAPAALAQTATWEQGSATPASGDWNDPLNWSGDTVPADTAVFGHAATTSIFFSQDVTQIGTLQFTAQAPQYVFDINGCLCQEVHITGVGVVNLSATGPIFNVDGGMLFFENASTAGNAQITNTVGVVAFSQTSTAGSATIVNDGGEVSFTGQSSAGQSTIVNGGLLMFVDQSSAGTARIDNNLAMGFAGSSTAGGSTITNNAAIQFFDQTSAGTATIENNGLIMFAGDSSAGSATITNNGTLVEFTEQATAGNARIVNNGGSILFGCLCGTDTASAGSATITNTLGGATEFSAFTTAATATIINDGATSDTVFFDSSTAGNATIVSQNGGATYFFDYTTGSQARFVTGAGSFVDFANTTGPNDDGKISAGSIEGAGDYFLGSNELTVGGNNLSTTVSGTIHDGDSCGCGPTGGSLVKVGTGTLTLTGTNTYTGATTVDQGALIVHGSIAASSLLTVNAGGLVGGTGVLPSTVIDGGTLSPGASIGTISVAGSLSFTAASYYLVEVSATDADRTNVAGTATLAGTVVVQPLGGAFLFNTYTILSAAALAGQFDGVASANPYVAATLGYAGNTVSLTLRPNLTPFAGNALNQRRVAAGLQSGLAQAGGTAGFEALFQVPTAAMPAALSQLSGEVATGASWTWLESMRLFLGMMVDPHGGTRGEAVVPSAPALGFAPDRADRASRVASAFAGLDAPAAPRWSVWGGAFGSKSRLDGDAAVGSHTLDARSANAAGGFDYRPSPDAVVGFALAGGSGSFRLADGLGSGNGDIFQAGLYGTKWFGATYLSGAAAFARFDVSTERLVALPGTASRIVADYSGHMVGGRLEAGHRFGWSGFGLTPYGALLAQAAFLPSYGERVTSGPQTFALGYGAETADRIRSEIGAGIDRRMLVGTDAALSLYARAAWAHEFSRERSVAAAFPALFGSGFTVTGAPIASDVALVTAGGELALARGLSLRAKFEGEFASGSYSYGGSGALRYVW